MLRAIESLVPDVEASTVVPPLAQVAALAAVFGTRHTHTCGWYTPAHELPASLADPPASLADPAEGLDPLAYDDGATDPEVLTDPPAERLYALAFEYGAADPALLAATLWQRVRPVLLARLKTNDRPEDARRAFAEARHLAQLVGLDAETYLTRATAELPDPKSWAKEEAALQDAQAEASAASAEESTASSDVDSSLAGDEPPDDEDVFCPQCGGPLPPGRVLCDICDDGDTDPGDLDDLVLNDPLPIGPLDAEALCY